MKLDKTIVKMIKSLLSMILSMQYLRKPNLEKPTPKQAYLANGKPRCYKFSRKANLIKGLLVNWS